MTAATRHGDAETISIPASGGALRSPVPPPPVELHPVRPPHEAWGFETVRYPVRLANRGLLALARPETAGRYVGTADLFSADGRFVRRLFETAVPKPVPVGGSEEFDAHLDVKAFAGDYSVRMGFHERVGAGRDARLVPLAADTEDAPMRVRNTIFDAFIELVNACNFRCTFCPQGDLKRKQRPMDFDLAKKVVRDLAEMGHHYPIRVHLMGEPLLYPKFFDFVDYAHAQGQRILLATNGSRFQRERIEGILRSRLDEMVISLNTPEREAYDAQRGTAVPFDEYQAGIEAMVTEIVRRGAPPATRVNVLYDLAKAADPVELARIRGIVAHWAGVVRRAGGRVASGIEESVRLDPTGTTLLALCEGLELQWTPYHAWGNDGAKENGISGHVPPSPVAQRRDRFCSFPWRQLAVLVDGRTTACCVDHEGEISLGDARTLSIEEIWNGPELNRIREGFLRSRAFHPKCATCTVQHAKADFFPALQTPLESVAAALPALV